MQWSKPKPYHLPPQLPSSYSAGWWRYVFLYAVMMWWHKISNFPRILGLYISISVQHTRPLQYVTQVLSLFRVSYSCRNWTCCANNIHVQIIQTAACLCAHILHSDRRVSLFGVIIPLAVSWDNQETAGGGGVKKWERRQNDLQAESKLCVFIAWD